MGDPERTFRYTLILVGDPKQAIYGFRGGDVGMYLRPPLRQPDQQTWPPATAASLVDTITGLLGGRCSGIRRSGCGRLRPCNQAADQRGLDTGVGGADPAAVVR